MKIEIVTLWVMMPFSLIPTSDIPAASISRMKVYCSFQTYDSVQRAEVTAISKQPAASICQKKNQKQTTSAALNLQANYTEQPPLVSKI
jgi:hypothetical protein